MVHIEVVDFYSWRKIARELLKRKVRPEQISWDHQAVEQTEMDFGDPLGLVGPEVYLAQTLTEPDIKISKQFFELAKMVACHRDNRRWSLLYSVAWRTLFEEPGLLGNSIDPQVSGLLAMRKSVSRDRHKMKAFLRFKSVDISTQKAKQNLEQITRLEQVNATEEYLIAWFEPEHLILPVTTSFFVKRFTNINWSILTPDLCAHWDGEHISYTEGLETKVRQTDELEKLWLEYYKNIFNPARLKIKAMQSEMPKKYWNNLPEAVLIDELIRNAQSRTNKMIDQDYTDSESKLVKSSYVKQQQDRLRRH